ncbi:MAG: DNA polymerase IV [Planctomycetota bacterium]
MSPAAGGRVVLHADLDAFFASVEQLDDASLRGEPVLVGGGGRRGVVAAASYEARVFGCRSAMPTATALRLCPRARVVRPRFDRYSELSRAVFEVFETVTPTIEPLSIDEAFLDITGSVRALGPPRAIAAGLKRRVLEQTGLVVSVGVAPTKFVAKLASDLGKPDGLVVVEPDEVTQTLGPLPISRVFGIGPAAEKRLAALGVRTIGQLAALPEDVVSSRLGSGGLSAWERARGIDARPVVTDRRRKSIGHEQTFGEDLRQPDAMLAVVLEQTRQVARRLRTAERLATGLTLKLRSPDFETVTRSTTLDPTDDTERLYAAARALFERWRSASFGPLRLIGVSLSPLVERSNAQLGLFGDRQERRLSAAERTADEIARRFGTDAIARAASLRPKGPQRGAAGSPPAPDGR